VLTYAFCPALKGPYGIFSLDNLTRPSSSPWSIQEDGSPYTYYFNFCENLQGVPSEVRNLPRPSPAVQVNKKTGEAIAVGYLNNLELSETGTGIKLLYINDIEKCADDKGNKVIPQAMTIYVDCDPKSEGAVFKVISLNVTACRHVIHMKHKAACPVTAYPRKPVHTLLFKVPPSATQDNVAVLFHMVSNFQDTIPGIVSYSGGPYHSSEGLNKGYTHAFSLVFENEAARDNYLVSPVHRAIGVQFTDVDCGDTLAFDYLI